MTKQLAEGENEVQLASIWRQNECLEGLGRDLWDQTLGLMWPKGSQGRMYQFRSSILGFVWETFWKTLASKMASKDEVCFRCTFGIEIRSKIYGFWYQIRTEWRWYVTRSSEKRKVDFWTTVHAFWWILVVSKIHRSLILEAQINLKTNLETDLNLASILYRFGCQNLVEISSQMHSKTRLDTISIPEPFLGALGAAGVEVR